jgi:hypothetical protein
MADGGLMVFGGSGLAGFPLLLGDAQGVHWFCVLWWAASGPSLVEVRSGGSWDCQKMRGGRENI